MTLVEVLLALVILTVGVSSLMTAMSRCLAVVRTARNREVAQGLMLLVDIENPIESVDMTELSESGDFEDREGFKWFRNIIIVDEENRPGLFEVTTRVQWSQSGRNAFEETKVFKYAPNAKVLTEKI